MSTMFENIPRICRPAEFFLTMSCIILLVIFFVYRFTTSGRNIFCLGSESCDISSTYSILVIKFLYIFFWTWFLNMICNRVDPDVSWFLVYLPFFLLFGMIMYMYIDPNIVHQWYVSWHK